MMTLARKVRWISVTAVVLLAAAVWVSRGRDRQPPLLPATAPASPPTTREPIATGPAEPASRGFLYGRITTVEGATYQGRLRWAGDQEAFWTDSFQGAKEANPWVAEVPPGRLPAQHRPLEIFGFKIADRTYPLDVRRQLAVPFGTLVKIAAVGRLVDVTLKSGAVVHLDRFDASDFDDGVRVWDDRQGTVDLDSLQIRTIELFPTAPRVGAPTRLFGTVHTRQGEFTGFLAWNRQAPFGSDELHGNAPGGRLQLRFDSLRAIERQGESCRVSLVDGREIELSGTPDAGHGNAGIVVEDPRYGRVVIAWEAFERVEFRAPDAGDSGPGYDDFSPGRPLAGSVTTQDGRRMVGRLVYDLDESETTETLDALVEGLEYTLPFARVAAIERPRREDPDGSATRVILDGGEELLVEARGDLGERNAGLLVFVDGARHPTYLRWTEVRRIDFDRPGRDEP